MLFEMIEQLSGIEAIEKLPTTIRLRTKDKVAADTRERNYRDIFGKKPYKVCHDKTEQKIGIPIS